MEVHIGFVKINGTHPGVLVDILISKRAIWV